MKNFPIKTEYYENFSRDFEGEDFPSVKIDKFYKYRRKAFGFRILSFILYRCIATPAAFIYCKLFIKDRVYGKDKLKAYNNSGFFIYGNHTRDAADAFLPSIAAFPKKVYVIVNSKNLSIPLLGKCLPYLGAIPTPTEISATRNFSEAIISNALRGNAVMIYPEAHLWPFMKDLRPFGSESFVYPVRASLPAFSLTRTYKKHGRKYRSEIYIDGPFFPDAALSERAARDKLCKEVRQAMKNRCSESDIEVVKYIKKENEKCETAKTL